MANPAAQKGTRLELDVVKKLTELTGVKYMRVPLSGASSFQKGDVMIDLRSGKMSNYCIECKNYADDQINSNLLYPGGQQFDEWWEQTLRQQKDMNSLPMLIFKKNRGKLIIALGEPVGLQGVSTLQISRKDYTAHLYLFDDVIVELHNQGKLFK